MLKNTTFWIKSRFHRIHGRLSKKQKRKQQLAHATPAFQSLPTELQQRVASFLSTRDLMHLIETSKSIPFSMDLEIASSPLMDQDSQFKIYQTGVKPRLFAVVIPRTQARFHSITFTCHVRKCASGDVSIVEQDLSTNESSMNRKYVPRKAGKVILSKPAIDNRELSMSFPIQPNKMYRFYVNCNSSASSSLCFEDMTLHRLGYGKMSNKCFTKQYEAFYRAELAICLRRFRI